LKIGFKRDGSLNDRNNIIARVTQSLYAAALPTFAELYLFFDLTANE
jgi:hypothetical protein